jgi:hypothetical protein
MKNLLKKITAIASVAILTGCVNDSFDIPKQDSCVAPTQTIAGVTTPLAKTKEVSAMWTLATNTTAVYTANDVLEAYVISSDEGGNFYKSMYLQPLDGSKGLNISYDNTNTFTKLYYPGRKVFVKLNGLAYANPTSFARGLVFGAPPTDIYAVDRLGPQAFLSQVVPSCDMVSEETYVKKFTTISAVLSDTYMNNLVEISGVQFKDFSTCNPITYSTKDFDTSLNISNGVASTVLAIRTSKYSHFAGTPIPGGNGTIRGVLSKYGSGYQIILRTDKDVKFTNPRVMPVIPPSPPAKIGTLSTTFNATLNENFNSYIAPTNDATIPKYINQVDLGSKYWDIKTFNGAKYLQTSAFNIGFIKNYFIVPVDFTAANGMSFKTLDGYNNGVPLKVYYSTTYTPGMKMVNANLIDITSNFILADGRLLPSPNNTVSAYASTFTPSGLYSFPTSLTGNGYIIFEYDGTCYTTTYQIDDIVIN